MTTTAEASKLDKELKQLTSVYSSTRVKIGFEMGARLKEVYENKTYLKLDEQSYPSFARYLESVGIMYRNAMELMSLHDCYIILAEIPIDKLSEISYYRLVSIKPILFGKKDGKYSLKKTKKEVMEWLGDAKSDLTTEDFKQHMAEEKVEEHDHKWTEVTTRKCEICKLKELIKIKK
jgi:hypothetical protein